MTNFVSSFPYILSTTHVSKKWPSILSKQQSLLESDKHSSDCVAFSSLTTETIFFDELGFFDWEISKNFRPLEGLADTTRLKILQWI
mmetsp:Transcript_53598/g.78262  ORF Transcript_53598/g.78262 Transcript_53598/m.78262 type:complete len:87 (+) Transcript_53598:245-505(+)